MTQQAQYGVRRFTDYRADGRCFELYDLATGECASLPTTKKDALAALTQRNAAGRTT